MTSRNELSQQNQLINYVKNNISKGYTTDTLKFALLRQGYSRTAINKAIEIANKQLAEEVPVIKEKPQIKCTIVEPEVPQKQSFFKKLFGAFK